MTDWQPIETAPKDGTWVTLFCPEKIGNNQGTGMAFARWGTTPASWPYAERTGWEFDHYDDRGWSPLFNDPTHWMQLPPQPQGSAT